MTMIRVLGAALLLVVGLAGCGNDDTPDTTDDRSAPTAADDGLEDAADDTPAGATDDADDSDSPAAAPSGSGVAGLCDEVTQAQLDQVHPGLEAEEIDPDSLGAMMNDGLCRWAAPLADDGSVVLTMTIDFDAALGWSLYEMMWEDRAEVDLCDEAQTGTLMGSNLAALVDGDIVELHLTSVWVRPEDRLGEDEERARLETLARSLLDSRC